MGNMGMRANLEEMGRGRGGWGEHMGVGSVAEEARIGNVPEGTWKYYASKLGGWVCVWGEGHSDREPEG
eukprot:749995-Hanusia_phi.AAC.2